MSVRGRSVPILALALALTACASVESTNFDEVTASTPAKTVDQSGSPAPTSTLHSTPTPQSTATPQPTPLGTAVFADPDDCTNPEGSYRVAYPDAWYSNAAVPNPLNPAGEGLPPCQLFAPTDFDAVYGTEIPADVAIWIRVDELPEGTTWNFGPFEGYRILTDSDTAVGGQPARVREIEVTQRNVRFFPGDRYVQYVIELSGSRYLVAQTISQQDYEASRLILDQMMQTLEFISL